MKGPKLSKKLGVNVAWEELHIQSAQGLREGGFEFVIHDWVRGPSIIYFFTGDIFG